MAAAPDQRYRVVAAEEAQLDTNGEARRLSHTGADGKARMVDVSAKAVTARSAEAMGTVTMAPSTLCLVRDNAAAKGDVLAVARLAGIMAAKKTSDLIPLCHGLPLDHVEVIFDLDDVSSSVVIRALARTQARTGVEMEAMTAVSIAGLTIYDMLKAVDRAMIIGGIRLLSKSGGRSGTYRADDQPTPAHTP